VSLSHSLVINPPPRARLRTIHNMIAPKEPFRVLAVIPGYLRELRQDPPLLRSGRDTVSRSHGLE